MHILCPHCQGPIELVKLDATEEILCPACGSTFRLEADSTRTWTSRDGRRTLGKFELIESIGVGAFGTVYRARDQQLDRIVAIKIPRSGNLINEDDRSRFLREACSVARLRHPAIVPLHDVGEHEGVPYLVSDFVQGKTLSDLLTARRPAFRESAKLVAVVADALQYAHEQGVVHRDVKPSNILLDEQGQPHLMDFGLAKREAAEVTMTLDGQVLGTPAYMSPEQARGLAHRVDGRSDVYSLGVILYLLLAGELPFRGNARMLLDQVLHDEPRPPRKLNDRIPRDLETICLKAMQKAPERRYITARELAEDLRRFLAGEPIRARPVGAWERAVRWAWRRPTQAALVAASAVAALALVAAGVGFAYNGRLQVAYRAEVESRRRAEVARRVAEQQRQLAQGARTEAERALGLANDYAYFNRIALADTALRDNNPLRAETLLDECPPERRRWEWFYLKQQCSPELMTLTGHDKVGLGVVGVAYSADGQRIASGGFDRTLRIWDASSGQAIRMLQAHCPVWSVAFSPDGRHVASGGECGAVSLWDTADGREVLTLQGHRAQVRSVAFSPDGRHVASASHDGTVRIWDTASGRPTQTFRGHTNAIIGVVYSPDGRRLATASWDGSVRTWDADSGREGLTIAAGQSSLICVAFSPDGRLLASGGLDGTIKLWDASDGRSVLTLAGHSFTVQRLAFSPDGRHVASASSDGTVRTWDVATGRNVATLRGHHGHVLCVTFHPEGDRLASAGVDATVKVWDATNPPEALILQGLGSITPTRAVFSLDGRRLATVGLNHAVQVWDVATFQLVGTLIEVGPGVDEDLHPNSLAFSPDGRFIAFVPPGRPLTVWDVDAGQGPPLSFPAESHGVCVAYSPDGRQLAVGGKDGTLKAWDASTRQLIRTLRSHAGEIEGVSYSPDGRRLASAGVDRTARLWDAETGQELRTLSGHTEGVRRVVFSPDGRHLATASSDGTARIWDASTGRELLVLSGHSGSVHDVAYHPDGRRLATSGVDRSVKIWDTETGQEALTLTGHANQSWSVAFQPDGRLLASSDQVQVIRLWSGEEPTAEWRARRRALTQERARLAYRTAWAEALAQGQWFAADWLLSRLIADGPPQAPLFEARATARAQLGRWEEASDDLGRACDLPDAPCTTWLLHALLRRRAGDAEGHRQVLAALLERFGATDDPQIANDVAWACVRFPDSVAQPERPLELARLAVERMPAGAPPSPSPLMDLARHLLTRKVRDPNALNTLGAALYRIGHFEEAVEQLDEAIRNRDSVGLWADWLFLAMAHHRLGHAEEARTWLDKTTTWAKQLEPGPAAAADVTNARTTQLDWPHRVEFDLLLAEAKALINRPALEEE